MKSATADHSTGDESEEALHLIQPGATGGREVELEALTLFRFQPTLHFGALMGAVVVHDQMHLLSLRQLLLQVIQKADKLAAAMPLLAGTDDFSVQDVERGKQRGRTVTLVIMGLALRQPGPQGKNRRGSIQRLDLTFLIHAQH